MSIRAIKCEVLSPRAGPRQRQPHEKEMLAKTSQKQLVSRPAEIPS